MAFMAITPVKAKQLCQIVDVLKNYVKSFVCVTWPLMIINQTMKTPGGGQPTEKQQRSVKDKTGGSSVAGLIKVKIDKVFIAP